MDKTADRRRDRRKSGQRIAKSISIKDAERRSGEMAALVALFVVQILRPAQSRAQEPLLAAYGIVLWVRPRSPDREEKARHGRIDERLGQT